MTLQLKLRKSIGEIAQLGLSLLKYAAISIHQRVVDKRAARLAALPPSEPINIEAIAVPALTLTEGEILAVSETAQLFETDPLQDEMETTAGDRHLVVMTVLDQGWQLGLTSYPKLIDYVKEQTGEGCSRRAIASWKRERGLING